MKTRRAILGLMAAIPALAQFARIDLKEEDTLRATFVTEFNMWEHARRDEIDHPGTYNVDARRSWESCRNLWKQLDIIERNI